MSMSESGELKKLTILAFTDPKCDGAPVSSFEAYVNPSELTLSYEIEYDEASGAGTTNARMNFKKMKPGNLVLTFFLDGTGASGRPADVQKMIEHFQQVTGYIGKIHRPNYLMLMWGTLQVRRCVLKGAAIAYKLFRPDGIPLRAVITATFTDFSDDQTRLAKAEVQSSDLTHRRIFHAGDNLPLLCHEIYGDPRLFLRVAQANGIDDFRNIAPGTAVFFPPLEK